MTVDPFFRFILATLANYTLEKVTDINKIMSFGVMVTPALVVDGKVRCSGSVPSVDQIATMLK